MPGQGEGILDPVSLFPSRQLNPKQQLQSFLPVTLYHRLKEFLPALSTMRVAVSQYCSFAIAELVEEKESGIANILEVPL